MSATLEPALIGAAAALVASLLAQAVAHRLARRRETAAAIRRLAAQMLGRGRTIQFAASSSVNTGNHLDVALLTSVVGTFVAEYYEVRWAAPPKIRGSVAAFADSSNALIKAVARPDIATITGDELRQVQHLEDSMVSSANDLVNDIERWLHPLRRSRQGRDPNV